jgi:alkylhydroperoxidase/carboxymuconolactone decarboxylase family protein YurZ
VERERWDVCETPATVPKPRKIITMTSASPTQTQTRSQTQTTDEQRNTLRNVAQDDEDAIAALIRVEVEENIEASGLDAQTYAMCNLAVLIATRAEAPSFVVQVARALDAGCTPEQILGVLTAVAPNVGIPKIVDATPRMAAALGIDLAAADTGDAGAGAGGGGGAGAGGGAASPAGGTAGAAGAPGGEAPGAAGRTNK